MDEITHTIGKFILNVYAFILLILLHLNMYIFVCKAFPQMQEILQINKYENMNFLLG